MSSAAVTKCNLSGEVAVSLPLGRTGQTTKQNDYQDSMKPCKPKRPLSAYNLFFKHERGNILAQTPVRSKGKPPRSHGKIGFAPLARIIADKWKNLDDESLDYFYDLAAEEKTKYKKEKAKWKKACLAEKRKTEMSKNNWQGESVEQSLLEGKTPDLDSIEITNSMQDKCHGDSLIQCQTSTAQNEIPPEKSNSEHETNRTSCSNFTSRMDDLNFSRQIKHSFLTQYKTTMSPLNEKNLPGKNLALNDSYSLLSVTQDIILAKNLATEKVNLSAMGLVLPQESKTPDMSELAAKLDDDCMDLLCSW